MGSPLSQLKSPSVLLKYQDPPNVLDSTEVYSSSQQFVCCLNRNIRDLPYVFLSSPFFTPNISPFSISTITLATLKDFFFIFLRFIEGLFVCLFQNSINKESNLKVLGTERRCLGSLAISSLCNVYYVTMGKLFICIKQSTPYFHIC